MFVVYVLMFVLACHCLIICYCCLVLDSEFSLLGFFYLLSLICPGPREGWGSALRRWTQRSKTLARCLGTMKDESLKHIAGFVLALK